MRLPQLQKPGHLSNALRWAYKFIITYLFFYSGLLILSQISQEFLLLDEIPKKSNQTTKGKKSLVDLDRVTAKWPSATEGNTLSNLSFTVRPGQVMAVVGQVGSGKVLQS